VQIFNDYLCETLRALGHEADYVLHDSYQTPGAPIRIAPGVRISRPRLQRRYDFLILSGTRMDYAGVLSFYHCPALVWTHGQHVSPLRHWDGAQLHRPGVRYICTNRQHFDEAKARGFEARAVMIDMPVQFAPRPVRPAGGYCMAVGTLEPRKDYARVAEIAAALGIKTRVYGSPLSGKVKAAVGASPWLEYMGERPHEAVLDDLAGADFLIHASHVEGRPTAVLEALGLGVPVIAPDLPLCREFVDPKHSALLGHGKVPTASELWNLRGMRNREALAAEAHARYGTEVFKGRLAELLGKA